VKQVTRKKRRGSKDILVGKYNRDLLDVGTVVADSHEQRLVVVNFLFGFLR